MKKEEFEDILHSKEVSLIFLSAVSYLVSYFFELSYLNWYQIPGTFVDISLTTLIVSVGFTTMIAFLLLFAAADYIRFEREKKVGRKILIIMRVVVCACVLAVVLFTFNIPSREFLKILAISLPSALLGVFMVELKNTRSIKATLRIFRDMFKPRNVTSGSKLNSGTLLPERLIIFIATVLLAMFLAATAGKMYARSRTDLSVIYSQGNTRRVIVTKSGTWLIAKDYDIADHKFKDGYYLIKANESQSITESLKIEK